MGWCSGTEMFDAVVKDMLRIVEDDIRLEEILLPVLINFIKALWQQDWDCESDSDYFHHPFVKRAMIAADIRMKLYYQELLMEE